MPHVQVLIFDHENYSCHLDICNFKLDWILMVVLCAILYNVIVTCKVRVGVREETLLLMMPAFKINNFLLNSVTTLFIRVFNSPV